MSSALPQRHLSIDRSPAHALGHRQRGVEVALRRFCERAGWSSLHVRHVFAAAIRAALLGALDDEQAEAASAAGSDRRAILLGLGPGPRVPVPVSGLRLLVSVSEQAALAPHAVTPFVRLGDGMRAAAEVGVGDPDHLVAAARIVGASQELGLDALRAILRELARLTCPRGTVTARFLGESLGWQSFHLVEVVGTVRDPAAQIAHEHAVGLDPDSQIGDLLGLSLPSQDWLTPLLLWMRGAG